MKVVFLITLLFSFYCSANTIIRFGVGHDHEKMVVNYPFYAACWQLFNTELKKLGYQVAAHPMPWARAQQRVASGQLDGLFLAANFHGRDEWAELTNAVGKDQFGIFNNVSHVPNAPIGSVRLLRNDSQVTFVPPDSQLQLATAQNGLKLLANRKLSGFIMSRSYGEYMLQNELKSLSPHIEFNEQFSETYTAHVAVSKKRKNADKIIEVLNLAIENAKTSGRYMKIMTQFNVAKYQLTTR